MGARHKATVAAEALLDGEAEALTRSLHARENTGYHRLCGCRPGTAKAAVIVGKHDENGLMPVEERIENGGELLPARGLVACDAEVR